MDYQLLLILLLSVLTVNMLVVGFYIIATLKDLRQTLSKLNTVLDDTSSIVHNVANPLAFITTMVTSITKAISSAKSVTSLRGER
ncbi:hypothetical protein EBU94_00585 [bacterium]|jgi:hypothetical protein|nr:hypothetical protein [bacterium]NBO36051.1 hypothetical protein [bacterium]